MMNTLPKRIRVKIVPITESGCWIWVGGTCQDGYGHVWWNGKTKKVHRVVWELLKSKINEGLTLDHLCRVRDCVNPCHLEPVTMRVNTLRGNGPAAHNAIKSHCHKMHPFDFGNTYMAKGGKRKCRECGREACRKLYARKMEKIRVVGL